MNRTLYRLLIKTVPKPELRLGEWTGFSVSAGLTERLRDILRRERVQGGVLALMNAAGETTASAFGISRLRGRLPAQPGDFFRCASISKYVTAAGVLRLAASGRIDLDRDISEYLGYAVRHPKATERALTLRLLISHRAGLRDGESYQAALTDPVPLSRLLNQPDSYMPWAPDGGFEYSNLGAGMVGAVLEAALGEPFDDLMGAAILEPAGVSATYLPQRVTGRLADAWRLMPPSRVPLYDAEARQKRPGQPMNPERDYLSAHGGLCVTAEGLLRLAAFTLADPACAAMRGPLSDFGQRDPHLQEGLGSFIYRDHALGFPLYGHQGLAYGAVHGLFFRTDSAPITGFALMTAAASEQRDGVVTALNRDVARTVFMQ